MFLFLPMNLDEFPSLDFLLPYTGNALQMKLIIGALVGLVTGILLIVISSLLVIRVRRKKKQSGNASSMADSMHADMTTGARSGTTNGNESSVGGLSTLALGGEQSTDGNISGVFSDSTDSLEKNPDVIPQGMY